MEFDELSKKIIGLAIEVHRVHEAQLLTYMRLANIKIDLLMNFNEKRLKDGIRRFVL
ncbi:MAG: GxxExxY protein [bacterium]